jgi:pilus assembly protein CpaC
MSRFASIKRQPMARILVTALAVSLLATPSGTIAAAKAKPKMAAKAKTMSGKVTRGSLPSGLRSQKPVIELPLSVGRGQLITLPGPYADIWVANDQVADVQSRGLNQIFVFAKSAGESTIFATSESGAVIYSATVRSGTNINSIDSMLKMAMPDALIQSTAMNGLVLLTGTVANPDDSAEAERLVQAFVGESTKVVSRLRSATPLQVNLQVKIAEVNRALLKEIGVNLANRDIGGGIGTVIGSGRNFVDIKDFDTSKFSKIDASTVFGLPPGSLQLPFDPVSGQFITGGSQFDFKNLALGAGKTSIGIAGKLFGLDAAAALDLAETEGLVTTLAQPNLTALSGETASFLAGGEFPIPISQELGTITIQYKQYGVSLAFTPTVLADGRISMRVRPEVSELSQQGAIRLNGFNVPGITTRRAETTVELGSGQAFMIAGLMRNTQTNSIDRAPGLGNVPILGALFRSTSYRKDETELVIIVTPVLVKPVNPNQIVLPTDGFKTASDLERVLLGRTQSGSSGGDRPKPISAPETTVIAPRVGAIEPLPQQQQSLSAPRRPKSSAGSPSAGSQGNAAAPGFSGN